MASIHDFNSTYFAFNELSEDYTKKSEKNSVEKTHKVSEEKFSAVPEIKIQIIEIKSQEKEILQPPLSIKKKNHPMSKLTSFLLPPSIKK